MRTNSKADIQNISQKIIDLAGKINIEVMIWKNTSSLTRYADNYIHQNVSDTSYQILMRPIIGKKTATATTNMIDDDSLKETLHTAIETTKLQKNNDKLLPLPGPQHYKELNNYSVSTDRYSAMQRADGVSKAITICKKNGLDGAGIFSTNTTEAAIANSEGLFGYDISSRADFSITAMKGAESGWREIIKRDVTKIDTEEAARIACEKALKSAYPEALKPGKYTVIMEPAAVAEFIMFLLWKGFNGMDYLEGTTFLTDGLNKKVFSDKFSIYEDPFNPEIGSQPFDYEGMPVEPVILVKKGIPRNFLTNRWIAKETKVKNNGHGIPLPRQGAYPFAMRIENGDSSVEQMIKNTKNGVLVTHFHYSNLIDPIELLTTGMTRDGFFLIENGEISNPLKNMRFTESVINVFSNIVEIGKTSEFASGFFGGGFLVPAMKIENFNFSSGTEF